MKKKINRSIVLAGSKGIGKAISKNLSFISQKTIALSSKNLDTSKIGDVKKFIKKYKNADVLVLNTGGPESLDFKKITEKIWIRYFNQFYYPFTVSI